MNQESVENYKYIIKDLKDKGSLVLNNRYELDIKDKCFNIDDEDISVILQTKNRIFTRELPFEQLLILNTIPIKIKFTNKELHKTSMESKYDIETIKKQCDSITTNLRGIRVCKINRFDIAYLNELNEISKKVVSEAKKMSPSEWESINNFEYFFRDVPTLMKRLNLDKIKVGDTLILYYMETIHNNQRIGVADIKFCLETITCETWNYVENQVALIVCNFLDFLNHPKTEKVEIEYSKEENQKRISRGKLPYPSSVCIVRLDNVIKQYEKKGTSEHREFSHKFWVRGHYIHFRNKNRYRYLYNLTYEQLSEKGYQQQSGLISKFISAFIKGKGKLFNKRYEVSSGPAN